MQRRHGELLRRGLTERGHRRLSTTCQPAGSCATARAWGCSRPGSTAPQSHGASPVRHGPPLGVRRSEFRLEETRERRDTRYKYESARVPARFASHGDWVHTIQLVDTALHTTFSSATLLGMGSRGTAVTAAVAVGATGAVAGRLGRVEGVWGEPSAMRASEHCTIYYV